VKDRGEKQAADNEKRKQVSLQVHHRRIPSQPASLQFQMN